MDFEESELVELKREINDDLKKEIIAFANSSGGVIYVGVDDSGLPHGIESLYMATTRVNNMIRDAIKPDLTMFVSCEEIKANEKTILKINVQSGTEKPYYLTAKGIKPSGVFVRHGTSSVPASENRIRLLIKEADGDKYEQVRSLNQQLTFNAANASFAERDLSFTPSQFHTLGLTTGGDKLYTNLGLLLSDQCLHTIKVAKFQGNSKAIFIDRREFGGSLLKQIEEVYNYIDLNNPVAAVVDGLRRTEKKEFPAIAVREVLLNAVVHRDYSFSSSNLISIFSDRIEFVSVGGLAYGITLEDIMVGISVTRNEKLANIFYRLQLIEVYGTGLAKILDAYQNCPYKPEVTISDNAFRIILPSSNKNSSLEGLTQAESKVIDMLATKQSIGRRDVEMALDVSQTLAGQILKNLVDKGRIKPKGAGRSRVYTRA